MLVADVSEEDGKRLDTVIEFEYDFNLFTKILLAELVFRINDNPIFDLSEPKTDFVIELLAKMITISPNRNNNFEFVNSFEKRFENYIFQFDKYKAAITSKKATSTFIDEKIVKIGKKLNAFCEEIIIVDSKLDIYYRKFEELKNIYYTSKN